MPASEDQDDDLSRTDRPLSGRDILAEIAANGVQLVLVEEDDDHPSWSFTLGLWQVARHPEVVVFGLPPEVAADLLDVIVDDVEAGTRFAAGDIRDDILHGCKVYFGRVHESQRRVLLDDIQRTYGRDDVPAIQLIYPDNQGRWPWLPGVREGFAAVQPVLERIGPAGQDEGHDEGPDPGQDGERGGPPDTEGAP